MFVLLFKCGQNYQFVSFCPSKYSNRLQTFIELCSTPCNSHRFVEFGFALPNFITHLFPTLWKKDQNEVRSSQIYFKIQFSFSNAIYHFQLTRRLQYRSVFIRGTPSYTNHHRNTSVYKAFPFFTFS